MKKQGTDRRKYTAEFKAEAVALAWKPDCVKTISSPNYHMANSSIFRNYYLFTPSFHVIVHKNLNILEF